MFIRPEDGWDRKYSISSIAKLTIPDAPADGRYGYSVATDGTTIVVGAPGAGAAYVYTRPDMGWAQMSVTAKLTASDGASGSRFGHAVSVSGDTIVVGTPGGGGAGVAYVFTKPNTGWADTSASAEVDRVQRRIGRSVRVCGIGERGHCARRRSQGMRMGKDWALRTCSPSLTQDGALHRYRRS